MYFRIGSWNWKTLSDLKYLVYILMVSLYATSYLINKFYKFASDLRVAVPKDGAFFKSFMTVHLRVGAADQNWLSVVVF